MVLVVAADEIVVVIDFADLLENRDGITEFFFTFPVQGHLQSFALIDAAPRGLKIRLRTIGAKAIVPHQMMDGDLVLFIEDKGADNAAGMGEVS